jgi:hypothetical protein
MANSEGHLDVASVLDMDDKPHAIGGSANGRPDRTGTARKGGRVPPWAILAIGGTLMLVVVIAILAKVMGGHKPPETVVTEEPQQVAAPVRAVKAEAQPSAGQQTQQTQTRAPDSAPHVVDQTVSTSTVTPGSALTAVSQSQPSPDPVILQVIQPDQVGPPQRAPGPRSTLSEAQAAALEHDVATIATRVNELDVQVQQVVSAFTGEPPTVKKVLITRVRTKIAAHKSRSAPTPKAQTGNAPEDAEIIPTIQYDDKHSVAGIIGTRAWIRANGNNASDEVAVAAGDYLDGVRVRTVDPLGKEVILANGVRVR